MTRLLFCCLVWISAQTAVAAVDMPVVQEFGVCRFLLHHYELSRKDQASINRIIGDLLKEHEQAFDFHSDETLRIQIRIFGREEDFLQFARTNQIGPDGRPAANLSTNLAGYYSPCDREVVTWRQRDPSYLANNILHECSHAIMHHQFRSLPLWLDEGCAVYFEFPRSLRDENDEEQLRAKWQRVKTFLDEGTLPNLREFLDQSGDNFRAQPPERAYTVSWSLVQLLMSTPGNRRAMNEMLGKYQSQRSPEPDCAALLNAAYPGGLAKMETDWKAWIARGATNVLSGKTK